MHGEARDPATEVNPDLLPGLRWGRADDIGTPAFWAYYAQLHAELGDYEASALGQTLVEEVIACVLCGHGVRAEVGLAAFRTLRDAGMLQPGVSAPEIERFLVTPLSLADGTLARYRFPFSKARIISTILQRFDSAWLEIQGDEELRDRLTTLPGVGLKTASFAVRNFRGSNAVAILDVHVVFAGQVAGLFELHHHPATKYLGMA